MIRFRHYCCFYHYFRVIIFFLRSRYTNMFHSHILYWIMVFVNAFLIILCLILLLLVLKNVGIISTYIKKLKSKVLLKPKLFFNPKYLKLNFMSLIYLKLRDTTFALWCRETVIFIYIHIRINIYNYSSKLIQYIQIKINLDTLKCYSRYKTFWLKKLRKLHLQNGFS